MAYIYLVRHGQTDFIGKILCGNLPGIHLNDLGKKQAQASANYLSKLPIKAIYSSPMERARETASALAQISSAKINVQEFLREVNFGDFQGKESDFLLAHPVWQTFIKTPVEVTFPGGESVINAQKRISEGLDALSLQYQEEDEIVCYAHCEILLLAVSACLNLSVNYMHRLTIHPASVTLVEWTQEQKALHLLNYQP
ncbi:MAG: histidine phosphatase family protein [Anaerolineaceae bacterium]|nr:histidine phosphatase family protein [Anaerolineaceae bacterium]